MVYPVPYMLLKRLVVYCTPRELPRGLLPVEISRDTFHLTPLLLPRISTSTGLGLLHNFNLGSRAQVSTLNIALFSVVSAYVLCFTDYTTDGF